MRRKKKNRKCYTKIGPKNKRKNKLNQSQKLMGNKKKIELNYI